MARRRKADAELGVTTAIQTPPGHVLAAITADETPGVTSIAVDDAGWDNALRRAAHAATGT